VRVVAEKSDLSAAPDNGLTFAGGLHCLGVVHA